jgi:peptidyl-prolyl cis-trans isomerase SurA
MQLAGNMSLRWVVALLALIAVSQMPATRAQAQQAAAEEAVTESEIEQRTRLWAQVPGKSYTREQVVAELREEKRKIREAGQAGVDLLDAEVDAEYARMARRMNVTAAQLTENLAQAGVGPETIKHRLHADIAWQRYQKERQQP